MKITIKGPPVAKNRHKCGCAGSRPFAYDPQIKSEMNPVREEMLKAWNEAFYGSDIEKSKEASNLTKVESFIVKCTFVFPIPRSLNASQKNAKIWGFSNHNIKPDLDNLEKFYLDCATGIIWMDDAQVISLKSSKQYGENPYTEIEILPMQELKLHPTVEEVLKVFGPTTLKEFLRDAKACSTILPEKIDELLTTADQEDKKSFLTASACILIEFANKYATELKKIQKFKDLIHDLALSDQHLKEISL